MTHTISIKTKEVKVVYHIVDNDKLKKKMKRNGDGDEEENELTGAIYEQ
jgi:hypothetical protein